MAASNCDKVVALLTAIRSQDETALQYVSPDFVQYLPSPAGGVEEFRQYIEASSPGELKLQIIRTLEDGPYVVAQLKSELSGENTFAVYRFRVGLIAEQWAFTSPDAPPNQSGHTQLDGPTEAQHLEATERNKAFAQTFYETNLSSASGTGGDWGLSGYDAAKGAVTNFTRALALEYGSRGVRINAVAPNLTSTEATANLEKMESILTDFRNRLPIGRAATPNEIASVIAFLASDHADSINGAIVPVDGGLGASNGQPNSLVHL